MNQIYDFEQRTPPVLNEHMLRAELERRKRGFRPPLQFWQAFS